MTSKSIHFWCTFIVSIAICSTGFAQDRIECGPDDIDSGFCGCDYGYALDGSCVAPGGGGGGGSSPSCNKDGAFYSYTDASVNDDGSFSAWTITLNTDGAAGERTLYASTGRTFPDGTAIPAAVTSSSSAMSVEAYLVSPPTDPAI